MKIQIDKELQDNDYTVKLSILESDIGNYLEAVHDFGEVPINFGGQILDTDDSSILATLSDRYAKVTDIIDNPIIQTFTTDQYGDNTEKIAIQWTNASVGKIDGYVKETSAKVDTFSGTQIVDV